MYNIDDEDFQGQDFLIDFFHQEQYPVMEKLKNARKRENKRAHKARKDRG